MRRIKLLYPPPYYYVKGFLQNHRFVKIGWIKLGDLTGLYAGSWKKSPLPENTGRGHRMKQRTHTARPFI